MKAPEKLYVDAQDNLDDSCLWGFIEKSGDEDIEYIRKDDFIEKACEFIAKNMTYNGYTLQTKTTFIRDFKKCMEDQLWHSI